ncbi:HAD family phosphatase [Paenibacillus dendritiformis]|nr:HAD family phosphatase [Paenibacillus dendritiformis]TDL47384.1 HAD family phosphatase [Paenibacillus dendritiformis]
MKAFIFDMDGVIIDSEPIHFEIDVETMKYFGVTIAPHELDRFVGMTNPEMWSILKQEYSIPQSVSEITEYQLKSKIELIRSTDLAPIEGIQELIFDLNKNNILIGLASSSPRAFINEVLRKYNFFEYFDSIISGEEVTKGKPAPDIYLEVSNQLNSKPNECWVLEDSKNGVQAAKAAGMKCIGFINQNSGNQDLSRADIIVNNIRDIKVMDLLL